MLIWVNRYDLNSNTSGSIRAISINSCIGSSYGVLSRSGKCDRTYKAENRN